MRRFAALVLLGIAVCVLATCLGDSTGLPTSGPANFAIAARLDGRQLAAADVNRVRVVLTRPADHSVALDTMVVLPAAADSIRLSLKVPLRSTSEDFDLEIFLLDPDNTVVFHSGPDPVTATIGTVATPPVAPALLYVGAGSTAAGVRFVSPPLGLSFQDTTTLVAEAYDGGGVTIPNALILWSSSDTLKAKFPDKADGRVVGGTTRGSAVITASLPRTSVATPPVFATHSLPIQPVPNAIVTQSGGGQTGTAGAPLGLPITVRVTAADNLGVAGAIVQFNVITGGGTPSQTVDTTNANGDAAITWTLGGPAGPQSLRATAVGVTGGLVNITATAVAGPTTRLAFFSPPSNVTVGASFSPTVQVAAQDGFGNVTSTYTGLVTLGIGTNPGSTTLAGTVTVNAVAGIASFPGVSLGNIGTGYTLTAAATGLTSALSGTFNVSASAGVNAWINAAGGNWSTAANWSRGTVPNATDTVWIKTPGTYTVNLNANATLARLDVGATSGTQTLQVNLQSLTMAGNGAFSNHGTLSVGGGILRGAGALDIAGAMNWTSGTIGGDGGVTRVNAGGVLSIAGNTNRVLVNHTIQLAGTGTWTGTGQIGSGSAGTIRVMVGAGLDIQTDATFTQNQGGSASRFENFGTVTHTVSTNSASLDVEVENDGVMTLVTGGIRLLRGSGPVASVGTFTVNAGATLDFAAGTYDLSPAGSIGGAGTVLTTNGTANVGGALNIATVLVAGGAFNYSGPPSGPISTLQVVGGALGGSGLLNVSGAMTWTAGSLAGTGGTTRIAPTGSLLLTTNAPRSFVGYTLEVAGTGTWDGDAAINSGSGAVLRVTAGASFAIQGDPQLIYNQGGSVSRFENFGTFTRSVSAGSATLALDNENDGSATISTGTLQLQGGTGAGTSDGSFVVSSGATLHFAAGANVLGPASSITGAGALNSSGGTVTVGGTLNTTGSLTLSGGGFNYNGASTGAVNIVNLNAGFLGGTGLLTVASSMGWTGGDMTGSGGTTRVLQSATLAISGNSHLTNQTLELAGSGTWSGSNPINAGSGSVFRVLPTGVLTISGTPNISFNQGGSPTVMDNQGSILRNAAGTATIAVIFNNSGSVAVTAGTLSQTAGGAQSGPIAVSAGAFIDYNGGTYTVANPYAVTGAGTARWESGTLNTGSATDTAKFATLQLDGGALQETGVVRVNTLFTWTGGNIVGAGKTLIANTASAAFTGAGGRTLTNGTLENAGTANWSGSGQINTGLGAVLRNVASGSFTLSSDGGLQLNQGGAATFDNQGTFLRSTSTGTATWTAAFIDTTASTTVNSGTFSLAGGGRFGAGTKAVGIGATLDFNSGTFTFRPATTFTGVGVVRGSGGVLTPDSTSAVAPATNAVTFTNFDLTGGQVNHEGLLVVNGGVMNWSGGNILSNTAGLGGTTRIAGTGTLNITGTGSRAFSGTHTLDLLGPTNYSGSGPINTGLGASMSNSALFTWSGDGQIQQNQGAPTMVFVNQAAGTLRRNTSAAVAVLTGAMNKLGAFDIVTGGLQLAAGSVTNFGGSVTGTGLLDLAGGTFGLTANMTDAGPLQVSSGILAFTGVNRTLSVVGNFTTIGAGELNMSAATDSLDVNGSVSFGGSAGGLTNGVIHVAGNFTQTGGTGFAPGPSTAPQRVVLDGTTVQTLNFSNTTNSFFRRLEVNKTAGSVALASNVRASWVRMAGTSAEALTGAFRLLTDTVTGGNFASSVTPLAVEISAVLSDSGTGFGPDTTVFTGNGQVIPSGSAGAHNYRSIRVAQATGVASFLSTVQTIPNDLVVSSGILNLTGATGIVVGRNFRTEGSGILAMNGATDNLTVNGSTTFAGGSTSGMLTAGQIQTRGNFTQAGTADAYAPSGTHRTTLADTAAQNISFANPGNSFFDVLNIPATATRNIVLLTNAQVNDSLIMAGGVATSTLIGASNTQRLRALGRIRVAQQTASPRLAPPVLEMSGANALFVVDSIAAPNGVNPDTTVFLAGATTMQEGSSIRYKSVRIATGGVITYNIVGGGGLDSIAGDLIIDNASTFSMNGGTMTAIKLRTINNGVLRMQTAGATLVVGDSAIFAGGSTTGLLTAGTLALRGNFVQQGGSTSAFAPSGAQATAFGSPAAAPTNSTIFFANPTVSNFASFSMSKGVTPSRGTVTLLSDVRATNGVTVANSTDLTGPGARLTISGGTLNAIISTTSPSITGLTALELASPPTVTIGGVTIDTVVFNGSMTTLPTGFNYQSIRVNVTGNFAFTATTLQHDLDIATGTAIYNAAGNLTINGKLRTRGTGTLSMAGGVTSVIQVADSAIFAGGSTATLLTGGVIRLLGVFVEGGGNPAAFQASPGHRVEFNNTARRSVSMADVGTGATSSRFGQVRVTHGANPSSINLLTNIQAAQMSDSIISAVVDTISAGAGIGITADSTGLAALGNIVFNGSTLTLNSGSATESLSNVRFQNMDPTSTYLTMFRAIAAQSTLTSINFATPHTSGHYLSATTLGAGGFGTITFNTSQPVAPGFQQGNGDYLLAGPTVPHVVWNGVTNP